MSVEFPSLQVTTLSKRLVLSFTFSLKGMSLTFLSSTFKRKQLHIYGIACGFFLNSEKLLFDAVIISCSSFLCFLHPSSLPFFVMTPYCCPYSLLIKSKLFSITFKALQDLIPIQPSSLTSYFPCGILYTFITLIIT